jgi:hypothetical protein
MGQGMNLQDGRVQAGARILVLEKIQTLLYSRASVSSFTEC